MPDPGRPVKAQLIELDGLAENANPKSGGKSVSVQFNPETLKVSFANQIAQPANTGGGSGDQSQPATRQFVGAGTTKLALQLWFDVGAQLPESGNRVIDVRELTKNVAYFITPTAEGQKFIPPALRFLWGSFHFDGMVDSLEESLEFFSDEGVPLRASVNLSMSQQRITAFTGRQGTPPPGASRSGEAAPGTSPLTQAPAGATLQNMAAGRDVSWQSIANANGIENPRRLMPGQLVDLNAIARDTLGSGR